MEALNQKQFMTSFEIEKIIGDYVYLNQGILITAYCSIMISGAY